MKYYYEYKCKNGCIFSGNDLEKIDFLENNYIKLLGVDVIPTNYDYEKQYWAITLNINKIEYLKIEPMLEKEND